MAVPTGSPFGLYGWKDGVFYTSLTSLYYNNLELTRDWGGQFTACEFMSYSADVGTATSLRTVLMANGRRLIITSGNRVWNIGITPPITTYVNATRQPGTSFLARHWYYKMTYINEDSFESNVSEDPVEILEGLCGGVLLTDLPIGPENEAVQRKRIYRTTSDSPIEGPYFLVATVTNDVTEWLDMTNDANLFPNEPPMDHDVPPQRCTLVQRCETRWFASGEKANPLRIYYSKPSPFAEAWPLTYYVDMPDEVVAMYPLGNQMVVLSKTTPFLLSVDSLGYTAWTELPSHVPCISRPALTWENLAFWRGPFGLYCTNGITIQEDSVNVRGLIPIDIDATSLTIDTLNQMLLTLSNVFAGQDGGRVVQILDTSDSPVDDYSFLAEVGRIVEMVDESTVDTYVFSREVGRVTYIEGSEVPLVSSTVKRETRNGKLLWSLSLQDAYMMSIDLDKKIVYAAATDGIYKAFTGPRIPWMWKSVSSYLGVAGKRKRLTQITMYVMGVMDIELYGDGVLLHTYQYPQDFYSFDGTQGIFTGTPSSDWNDSQWAEWEDWYGVGGLQVVKMQALWSTWAYTYQIKVVATADAQVHLPVQFYFEVEKNL